MGDIPSAEQGIDLAVVSQAETGQPGASVESPTPVAPITPDIQPPQPTTSDKITAILMKLDNNPNLTDAERALLKGQLAGLMGTPAPFSQLPPPRPFQSHLGKKDVYNMAGVPVPGNPHNFTLTDVSVETYMADKELGDEPLSETEMNDLRNMIFNLTLNPVTGVNYTPTEKRGLIEMVKTRNHLITATHTWKEAASARDKMDDETEGKKRAEYRALKRDLLPHLPTLERLPGVAEASVLLRDYGSEGDPYVPGHRRGGNFGTVLFAANANETYYTLRKGVMGSLQRLTGSKLFEQSNRGKEIDREIVYRLTGRDELAQPGTARGVLPPPANGYPCDTKEEALEAIHLALNIMRLKDEDKELGGRTLPGTDRPRNRVGQAVQGLDRVPGIGSVNRATKEVAKGSAAKSISATLGGIGKSFLKMIGAG